MVTTRPPDLALTASADAAEVRRRARAIVRAAGVRHPPCAPERYAARCGVAGIIAGQAADGAVWLERRPPGRAGGAPRWVLTVDRRLPPHTPQWNGAVALGLAQTLLPPGSAGERARVLAEVGAAELLLPMALFRPAAARTDLTLDGLRALAMRFAAPIRLTARQWLQSGTWHGFALLWREEAGTLRLGWRAASPKARFPRALTLGSSAEGIWSAGSRLYATHRSGRPHHGVEEVRTGAGPAWWFTRFGVVREDTGPAENRTTARAVLALVVLARGE